MNKKNLFVFRYMLCIIVSIIGCCACGATIPDYNDAASFENALNNGENVVGKIVTFNVLAISPDTEFGFNLWSGDHLNFCSQEIWDVQRGDELTVKIQSVANVGDSYIIRYRMLSDVEKVQDRSVNDNPFLISDEESIDDAKKNDWLVADMVHTAFLTAMMDPEVVNKSDYNDSIDVFKDRMEITGYSAYNEMEDNSIMQAAAEILDVKTFGSLSYQLRSTEATGKIYVTFVEGSRVRVEIDGTDIIVE
ncbi:MAG: hypothetical protein IKQ27_08515 [Lachnospiraceae bacterium]|nr:hypothetical protein [Lachnospiraceae bacterium]